MPSGLLESVLIAPVAVALRWGTIANPGANYRIDSTTKKFGCKFYPTKSTAITHINPNVFKAGTVTGINFTAQIETDSGGAPSGSVLGAATAAWAGPSANGFVGDKALGSNTGTLTVGAPYWLTVQRDSGTPDASNYIAPGVLSTTPSRGFNDCGVRGFNGTDWTTVSLTVGHPACVFKDSDGVYSGCAITGVGNHGSATDIFSTNRQALKTRFGCQRTILGVRGEFTKSGSPGGLTIRCYQGATEKGSMGTLAAADVISNDGATTILLATPATVDPDQDVYLVLGQASDGGSDSADYDVRGSTLQSGFDTAALPSNWRYCYGSGNDPTAFTVDANFLPYISLLAVEPQDDFDAVSGAGVITPVQVHGAEGLRLAV
ncbi:MAG: hypothetical protein ACT4QC_17715 [Planctomycetaceae bacterium]